MLSTARCAARAAAQRSVGRGSPRSVSVTATRARVPLRAPQGLRSKTSGPPAKKTSKEEALKAAKPKQATQMTREEVEKLAQNAKNSQSVWDAESRLFGGGLTFTSPYLWGLLAAVIGLHILNGQREAQREEEEAHLERLKQERRKPQPLTPAQRDQIISHKRQQLDRWLLHSDDDARSRAAKLSEEIAKLEADA